MSREDQKRQLPFWYDLRRLSGLTTCLFSFSFFFLHCNIGPEEDRFNKQFASEGYRIGRGERGGAEPDGVGWRLHLHLVVATLPSSSIHMYMFSPFPLPELMCAGEIPVSGPIPACSPD